MYYLSKLFNDVEKKYTAIYKIYAGVVWVAQKLKHYFLAHEVKLIAKMDPIRNLLEKPVLTEHLVRWQSFLSQFDITYVNQKVIKGYAITEHLAHLPLSVFNEINSEFSDEDLMTIQDPRDLVWSLYFDGAMNMKGRGIWVVLLSPEGVAITQACQLTFPATNNITEYEALLAGLKHAHILGVICLKVMDDSQVILR